MKKIFLISIMIATFTACRKAQIVQTRSMGDPCPWTDSSGRHPKDIVFKALLEKYRSKGLPGISLLINDDKGTWIGATGKADIENNIDFVPGTISKAASITKFFMSTLLFKLIEDSIHSGIGYNAIYTKLSNWLPARVID